MRVRRIAALDGVRGLAVLAVLLYHGETRPLPGGFLGVEVFFVLTGFLVSSVLVAEWQREGRVSLLGFWRRRAERLVPELAALVAGVLAYALFFEHGRVADLRWEALSGLGFAANWHFIIASVPYFRQFDGPSLLLHLWSIGVEAQLYVIAAPVLALALRPRWRRPMAGAVVALALGSALLAAAMSFGVNESRLYYGTDTRASGFLLGAALALLWQPSRPRGVVTPLRAALPVIGAAASLAGLLAAFLLLDASSAALYRGGMVGVDVLSIVLIVSVAQAERSYAARALSARPLTWLGERSYGIYLWHWPLFVVLHSAGWMPLGGLALLVFESALAVGLAALSFRVVYRPVRTWMQSLGKGRPVVSFGHGWQRAAVVGGGVLVASFLVAIAAVSPPGRPGYLQAVSFHGVVAASGHPAVSPTPWAAPTSTPANTPTPAETAAAELTPTPTATQAPATPTPVPATPTPTEKPAPLPSPPEQLHADVFAIGDSVMVGAAGYGYMGVLGTVEVDAHEGRQMPEYVSILRARAAAGTLPEVVVIHAGNNGPFRASHLQSIMAALGDSRRVVFVNVRVNQPWQDETNNTLAEAPSEYANVRVVDWYGATAGHPELFWDGMHVRPEGAELYATLIAQAVR